MRANAFEPWFVFLSLNAPHDPVVAPERLSRAYRQMFPNYPKSRIELLAAIRAIDENVERVVREANRLDRETLVIFQSDNGGRNKAPYSVNNLQSCNFPYKGRKNTLFEGGTLSPAFIYSTKEVFPERQIGQCQSSRVIQFH